LDVFLPEGKQALRFERFAANPEWNTGKYGIRVFMGDDFLGNVPYSGEGKNGALINRILNNKRTSAYISRSEQAVAGAKFGDIGFNPRLWFRTIEQGKRGGAATSMKEFELASTWKGPWGSASRGKGAASQAAKFEGFAAVRDWMKKTPKEAKIGLAIAGLTIGALMLRGKGNKPGDLNMSHRESSDSSLYGGATGRTMNPEGMVNEYAQERREQNPVPTSYNARIQDPNSIQTNIRIKGRTSRDMNFEAVGRTIGLTTSERAGAELGNVNVRVSDDSSRMDDRSINRRLARLI